MTANDRTFPGIIPEITQAPGNFVVRTCPDLCEEHTGRDRAGIMVRERS
jgi:hypothetical protein